MDSCCEKCINDKIINGIIEKEGSVISECIICESKNVKSIKISNIVDYFEMLLEIYDEDEVDGTDLALLIQNDWEIFFNQEIALKLIPKIIPYSIEKKYRHKLDIQPVKDVWENFKTEIKHNNRFFLKFDDFDIERFREWLNELAMQTSKKRVLYRARISEDKKLIEVEKMGKPPVKFVKNGGRANPVGISYLYTATDRSTAIAEVRPHKGDVITVAKIKIISKLRLADLRNPRKATSPFSKESEEAKFIFKYISLLQHFAEELSKPVLPRDAYLEYLPSQYLSELIKDAGFDGFIFKSSVGKGDNVVLFDDKKVDIIEVELFEVKELRFLTGVK